MPDLGVPAGEARPVAHLGTPEWQSFEVRMRARKAERCLQRAALALDNGSIAEASDSLEEARQLAPSHPHLQELATRLGALKQPPMQSAASPGRSYFWRSAAVVAGLMTFSAVCWETWVHRDQVALLVPTEQPDLDASAGLASPTAASVPATDLNQPAAAPPPNSRDPREESQPTTGAASPPTETLAASAAKPNAPEVETRVQTTPVRPEPVVQPVETPPPLRTSSESSSVATAGSMTRNETREDATKPLVKASELPAPPQRDTAVPVAVSSEYGPLTGPTVPTPSPANTSVPPVAPPPEPSRATAPTAAGKPNSTSEAAATSSTITTPRPSSAATPSAPPAVSAPVRDDRVAVRTALGRYESAYNRLDVDAVRSIWPSLDQRALARAFDGLASQRVSLQNCTIEVGGVNARANCSGYASWTPKIGGGEHTSARKWAFDLKQSDGAWRITHVQAR